MTGKVLAQIQARLNGPMYWLAFVSMGAVAISTIPTFAGAPLGPKFVVVAFMALGIALMFMNVRLTLYPEHLEIRMLGNLIQEDVPYRRIKSVGIGPVTGIRFGAGLRVLPKGGIGYLVGGPSIELHTAAGKLLVSVPDAQEAKLAILRARRSATGAH